MGKETSEVIEIGRNRKNRNGNFSYVVYHVQHKGDYIKHPSSPWEQRR